MSGSYLEVGNGDRDCGLNCGYKSCLFNISGRGYFSLFTFYFFSGGI